MKKKKDIIEKPKVELQQIEWNGFPAIGWWCDSPTARLYYGIHKTELESTLDDGIKTDTKPFSLEPNTSYGHVALKKDMVDADGKQITIHKLDRIVLVLEIPKAYFIDEVSSLDAKLTNRVLYDKWVTDHTNKKGVYNSAYDQQYYGQAEIRLPKKITAKYIVGMMLKPHDPADDIKKPAKKGYWGR